MTFACETLPCRVKVGLHVFQVTSYAARVRRCTRCQKLNHTAKFCKQSIQICPRCGGRDYEREGCSASPSCPNCSGPHSADWLGCPEYRTRLLANKITNIHAVQSRNQTGQTDTIQQHRNQQTCTHSPTILTCRPTPKPRTNSNTENSYANIVRQGRASDYIQIKTTQTSPKQTHRNTPQTSTLKTQCTKQAQTLATQHTTVGTQIDDTIAVGIETPKHSIKHLADT